MLHQFLLVTLYVYQASTHSWMSCPRSFSQLRGRGGTQTAPCERWYLGAVNKVNAGDRLKVGWTSNNHGGGYVRIALIPATTQSKSDYFGATESAFKQNVVKFACYGHDTRDGGTKFGDCVHPCNGRPGCEYQSDVTDVERFDTTITVPTNLEDGTYVLQTAMLVGNSNGPYYSCALLDIKQGDTSLNCGSSDPAPRYKCHRAGGPAIEAISAGTSRGRFCYHSDRRGEVDDRILEQPVNVDCDPRIYCGYSINQGVCYQEKGMRYLDKMVGDPRQPNCATRLKTATCTDGIRNQGERGIDCGGPCPTACATCLDGIQNQGEAGVDCGGPCAACPTCSDGIQNQLETGVDCGGPCRACAQCTDGIRNQGETGIDCGGPCAACPTCSDGKQNQGEDGVDCGGPCCNTCGPTCTDNKQNQGETGVDCGGPCKECKQAQAGDYVDVSHIEKDYGNGPVHITIMIKFLKDVPSRWKLRIEYNQKIDILSSCGVAKMIEKNELGNIFTFASNSWTKPPKAGQTRRIYVIATKTTATSLRPTGEFFEVGTVNEVGKRAFVYDGMQPDGPVCGEKRCLPDQYCFQEDILPCRGPCKSTTKCLNEKKEVEGGEKDRRKVDYL